TKVQGTATNDNATAGYVGEYIEGEVLVASAVSLTTATSADVTSISLTAGDWDVWGEVNTAPDGTTTQTIVGGWISTTSATFPTRPNKGAYNFVSAIPTAGTPNSIVTGMRRYSLSTTTTVYLTIYCEFAVSTNKGYGIICARRRR